MADVKEALITAIWNRLTNDPELKAIMGGTVRLYYMWAKPDAPFPYLVHRMDSVTRQASGREVEVWAIEQVDYTLDLWDYSPNAYRLWDMRARIIALLDEAVLVIPGGEAAAVRLWKRRERDMPEDAENIWRISTEWGLRYVRQGEVEAILAREEG